MKRFIQLPQVLNALSGPVSDRLLCDSMRRSKFPMPAKTGARSVWVDDDIAQWQQDRLKSRQSPA